MREKNTRAPAAEARIGLWALVSMIIVEALDTAAHGSAVAAHAGSRPDTGARTREDISLGTVMLLLCTVLGGALLSCGGLTLLESLVKGTPG